MGLLGAGDWRAAWIGMGPAREPRPPAGFFQSRSELTNLNVAVAFEGRSALLRREIAVRAGLRRATVYVTGLGYYELTCNGGRVGDQVLSPAKANYRKWVGYDVHDLTSRLRPGLNCLGLQLGNGWFNPYPKWWDPYRMQWFGSKRALLQLHLEYADGDQEVVVTDPAWKAAPGPVLGACIYDGETYDATAELPGWDEAGYDDAAWVSATAVEAPGGDFVPCLMPPIRVIEDLRPAALTEPKPGVWIVDLGQNIAGWLRWTGRGSRGTRVTFRYAEDLNPDGTLDPRSNEKAAATDVYVMSGRGLEAYEPRFTFHGFRYVEISGYPGRLGRHQVVGRVVHSACESTGEFACADELLNRIHRATHWSQRCNLMGYPMDCPQRDERLGWLGDAMVTVEEALFNFDIGVLHAHWLEGIRRNQDPATGDISIISPRPYLALEPDPTWSSAYGVVLWQYYVHTGDRGALARHYDAVRRYVDYLGTQATNHVLPRYWVGDWGSTVRGWREGDPPLVASAFYHEEIRILSKMAAVLGREADAGRYAGLAREVRGAFHRAFYDAERGDYAPGTQCSNALALQLGLAEGGTERGVLESMLEDLRRHNGHFTVGVLGAKYLLEALTDQGRPDVAYVLATKRGYPGWAHLIEGRTTLSEFWDLRGSHNHVMLGSVDAWFYRTLAGIQPDEGQPGFERFRIAPYVPRALAWVQAKVRTVRGDVAVKWEQRAGELQLRVSVPPNAAAVVRVPCASGRVVRAVPSLAVAERDADAAEYHVGSGEYRFRVTRPGR